MGRCSQKFSVAPPPPLPLFTLLVIKMLKKHIHFFLDLTILFINTSRKYIYEICYATRKQIRLTFLDA